MVDDAAPNNEQIDIADLSLQDLQLMLPPKRHLYLIGYLKIKAAKLVHIDPVTIESSSTLGSLGLNTEQLQNLGDSIKLLTGNMWESTRGFETLDLATLAQRICVALPEKCPFSEMSKNTDLLRPAERNQNCSPNPSSVSKTAPGPSKDSLGTGLSTADDDIHGTLLNLFSEYGEIVQFYWGNQLFHLISDPSDISTVFVKDKTNFIRGVFWGPFKNFMGENGMITTEGKPWRQDRVVGQPVFTKPSVEESTELIVEIAEDQLNNLDEALETDKTVMVHQLMKQITLRVILRKLLSLEDDPRINELSEIIDAIERFWNIPDLFEMQSDTSRDQLVRSLKQNSQYQKMLTALDLIVYQLLEERLDRPESCDDILTAYLNSDLIRELDHDDARKYLRDVSVTLIMTGFDTTASALFWTVYLLASHQKECELLMAELDTGEIFHAQSSEVLASKPYLKSVVYESLRLFPPVWYVGREVRKTTTLRGFEIPADSFILASPYVVHRNPVYWPSPDRFQPERFLATKGSVLNTPAYIPFGWGERICVGRLLALREIALVTALVFRRYDVSLMKSTKLRLTSNFTLLPSVPIPMVFHRRNSRLPY